MRLHDVQVTMSSADVASRYQVNHQQLAQAAQAQEALNINALAEVKKTQTQQAEVEQKSKEITEDEKRRKQWKKANQKEGQEEGRDESGSRENPNAGAGREHIIDIRA